MGPWDTVEDMQENESEEDIDMFAVLGAIQPTAAAVQSNISAPMSATSNDPLAAFMDDEDEDTLTADSLFSMNDEPNASNEVSQETVGHLAAVPFAKQ